MLVLRQLHPLVGPPRGIERWRFFLGCLRNVRAVALAFEH
jgi:hypothetical protein